MVAMPFLREGLKKSTSTYRAARTKSAKPTTVHQSIGLIAKAKIVAALHIGCSLFNRHRLRQIPGLIHVTPAPHRDVIGQQLQRDDFEDG